MKILFVLHLFSHTRHFHRLFEILADRGHQVAIVGLNALRDQPGEVQIPEHAAHLKGVTFALPPPPRVDAWGRRIEALRGSRNLLHYGHRRLRDADRFRRRAAGFAAPLVRALAPGRAGGGPRRPLRAMLDALERAAPLDEAIVQRLRDEAPDVLLVSPLIFNEMLSLTDWVKAAHALRLPVGFPVFSWDNLTTKGTTHALPDRIFVWNETQAEEGRDIHGWPADRIEVLGAWRFDPFLEWKPSLTRARFCADIGFDPKKPILLYIGSSPVIAPDEARFVEQWIRAVRGSSDPLVAAANILIRPHPRNLQAWRDTAAIAAAPGVALQAIEQTSLLKSEDLFEFIHHSHAVVGLVTSAMIEAAILGRPVHSIASGAATAGGGETVHSTYLRSIGGGLLHEAADFDDHLARLAEHLRRPFDTPDARSHAFVRAFVDAPGGGSPSERLADAIEALAKLEKTPPDPAARGGIGRIALATAGSLGLLPPRDPPPGAPPGPSSS